MQAVRNNVDQELRRYRQADALRQQQQQQFSELQRNLETANATALERSRQKLSERYKDEFLMELRSVQKEPDELREAHASDTAATELHDIAAMRRW
eukprot:2002163-Amphidinium_carterae.1